MNINTLVQSRRSGTHNAPFILKDGTVLSVQASKAHDCFPQRDKGPWTHFEVKTNRPELFPFEGRNGTFVNVPAKMILEIIEKVGLK